MKHLFTLIAFFAVSLCGFAEHQYDARVYGTDGIGIFYKLDRIKHVATVTNDGQAYAEGVINAHHYYGDMVIPDEISVEENGVGTLYRVTSIEDDAFQNKTLLKSIIIPSTITNIGNHAFDNCATLKTVTFEEGSNLQTIGDNAFQKCVALEGIKIPNTVTSLGQYAFSNCSALASVVFEEGSTLDKLKNYSFTNCTALASIDIPNSVKTIGNYCFANSGLDHFFPDNLSSLESIGTKAFYGCGELMAVNIPKKVTYIGNQAFFNSNKLGVVYCYPLVPPVLEDKSIGAGQGDIMANEWLFNSQVPSSSLITTLVVPIPATYQASTVDSRWRTGVTIKSVLSLELIDGEVYPYWSGDPLTYTGAFNPQYIRTFSESNVGKWNALYVPFAIDVNSDDYDIAEIFNLCPVDDTNGNGYIDSDDKDYLVISLVKNGATLPNKPYLIRPKHAGEMNITIKDATIYPASEEEGKVTCSTTRCEYEVKGTYKGVTVAPNSGFFMGGGSLRYNATESEPIRPNRWVMTKSVKGDYSSEAAEAKANIEIFVLGEDEGDATAIANILSGKSADRGTYTIDGRKVADDVNLKAGIYIKNGKKIVIK